MAQLSKIAFLKCQVVGMLKSAEAKRGKQYAKNFKAFAKLWSAYFDEQADEYIKYLEDNPQLTIGIQKLANDEEFQKDVADGLADTYILGMTLQELDIQEQLTIGLSFDIVNQNAIDWADSRVGELIK